MNELSTVPSSPFAAPALRSRETSSSAVAAQARAMIEARYVMALQRPRNADMARAALLRECARPTFAAVAEYRLPRGGKQISGPSIRFAEAALRALGNISIDTITTYDGDDYRIVRVMVVDLECNIPYSRDVTVPKTVERRQLKDGQAFISKRENSTGQVVYTVAATEDELTVRENALVSKALRTLALRLVPGDLIDEALAACHATIEAGDKGDPEAKRKALLDSFLGLGVTPADLAKFLGHPTDRIAPKEVEALRGVFSALKQGETTWAEVLAELEESGGSDTGATAADDPTSKKAVLSSIADLRLRVGDAGYAAALGGIGIDKGTKLDALGLDVLGRLNATLAEISNMGGRQ